MVTTMGGGGLVVMETCAWTWYGLIGLSVLNRVYNFMRVHPKPDQRVLNWGMVAQLSKIASLRKQGMFREVTT